MTGLLQRAVRGLEYLVYVFVLVGIVGLMFFGSLIVIIGGGFLFSRLFH